MVTISIIAIMAALVMGALHAARETAAAAATKATIAKLNAIIMQRYEGYLTRRVPVNLSGLSTLNAAQDRLYALRDLMRMEMPDHPTDITSGPITLPNSHNSITRPALSQLYLNRLTNNPPMVNGVIQTNGQNGGAELLYMIVSMGSPGAMEQFSQSEIGDTDHNGYPEFLDGWGRPIFFLRWAPGCSANHVNSSGVRDGYSDIQSGNPTTDHDPFDVYEFDITAYHLIPLIYSDGAVPTDTNHGIIVDDQYNFAATPTPGDIFGSSDFLTIGSLKNMVSYGGITNHHIDMR